MTRWILRGGWLENSAEVRRDIATMEGFMRTNATEDEFKWFGRVKGMTYNAVSAGVAAGTTLATGSSLIGFNTGVQRRRVQEQL